MSIDRFILKKLDTCPGTHTETHLLQLFKIRIHKAQMTEESYFNMK